VDFLVSKVNKTKSQLEIKWFLAIFIVTVITLLILTNIISTTLTRLYQEVAESSSENVAIQLSSLMSAAGSAPDGIDIEYVPSEGVLYDVSASGRKIEVLAKFSPIYIQKMPFESKFCTNFTDFKFNDVNKFSIQKIKENGVSYYKISAGRVRNEG